MSELRVEQLIEASPATVYRYLTEARLWAAWQGETASLDPRPGGRFSMVMENGMSAEGEFVELVPDVKVAFTWGWVGHPEIPPSSTRVEIVLTAVASGTLLSLTHHTMPHGEVEPHRLGWLHYLSRLAIVSEGRDPGPDPGPGS